MPHPSEWPQYLRHHAVRSLLLAAIGILVVIVVDLLAEHGLTGDFGRLPLRWGLYYIAIFLVLLLPGSSEIRTFIYFQF